MYMYMYMYIYKMFFMIQITEEITEKGLDINSVFSEYSEYHITKNLYSILFKYT